MTFHPVIARTLLIASLMAMPAVYASAQEGGTIGGVVLDAATGLPLKGATAKLRDPADSSSRMLGDVTDDSGRFSIEHVPFGRSFALEITFIGYEKHAVAGVVVTSASPTLQLGEIRLAPAAISTDDVEVRAQRPEVMVTADKTTYAVEGNPSYTAATVSELLGQIPSIDVDQDGKVSLRGNDNVTIMMNDRPITMPAEQRNKFLQSLPAAMVTDVEVRTSPGAEFDAKAGGGIINIVTRRTMSDLIGGNVNAGVDSRVGGNAGAGLYFNGKTLNASLGGGIQRSEHSGSRQNLRINYRDSVERREVGSGFSTSNSESYNGYGQIDYRITESDLVSLSFNVNRWGSDYTSEGVHTFYDIADQIVLRAYDTSAPGDGPGSFGGWSSASLLLKHTFKGDHKLSLDVGYNGHGYDGSSRYGNTYVRTDGTIDSLRSTARSSEFDRGSSTLITTLDYRNPLSDKLTLSAGAKNELNDLDNSTSVRVRDRASGELVVDTLQTNHYLPSNAIYAVYLSGAYRPIPELGITAGARLEYATVSASYASGVPIVTRDYTNIFPSASLNYTIAEKHSLTLGYRRSVVLPDIDALNPTRIRWSDYAEYSGNPDLEPELTQSLELKYDTFWEGGNMISVSPYYSTTGGNIEESQQLVNGVSYTSSANFNGSYSIGSEASVSLRPWKWLGMRLSGNLYTKVNRGSDVPGDVHSAASGHNASASINADLLEGMTFSVTTYVVNPPTVGGSSTSGYNFWSFNLRQRLLDNKLTISLRANDPFDLQKWETQYDGPDFHTEMSSKWSNRFVGLNVSYSFGTQPTMETHRQEKSETKGSSGSSGGGGGGGGQ